MTAPIVSTDPQALVRKAMAMIEANPEHWDQRKWHCGTSHCFFGFVELAHEGEAPTKEYSKHRDVGETMDVVRSLLGLTKAVAIVWSSQRNGLATLDWFERLFCDDLATLAIDKYDAEELLIVASRPDLTPEVGAQLIELVTAGSSVIKVLALNSRTPVETLVTIARTCSVWRARMLASHPSVVCGRDILSRMRAEMELNSGISSKDLASIFPDGPTLLD